LPIVFWQVGLARQPDTAIRHGFKPGGQIIKPIYQIGIDTTPQMQIE
jgi:hypothetical protein